MVQRYIKNNKTNSEDKENTSRFWDEEREGDAVYSIYLKKVRYHPGCVNVPTDQVPAQFQAQPDHKFINGFSDAEDVSHLQWETVKVKQIKAGTLDKLIENLTCQNGDLEQNFATIFLATFRSFTTPRQLMSCLRKRYIKIQENREGHYAEDTRTNHLRALRSIFSSWIDNYLEDFEDDGGTFELINELCTFAQNVMSDTELALRSLHKIEKIKLDALRTKELPLFFNAAGDSSTQHLNGNSHDSKPSKYLFSKCLEHFDESTIAEQLTYMDSELFKRVIPYECMGCFWAKKNRGYTFDSKAQAEVVGNGTNGHTLRNGPTEAKPGPATSNRKIACSTIRATVDFFNFVSFRVMDTILAPNCYLEEPIMINGSGCHANGHLPSPDFWMSKKKVTPCKASSSHRMKTMDRIKRLVKWIDVARELRMLKNFSSLKAVISALRSNPIYRLTKVWALVPKDKLALFEELSALCSEENNQLNQRTLLEKEGTAKMVDPKFPGQGKRLKKQILRYKRSHSDMGTINGTVPYLGTFLTDLTMLDTMYPDHISPDGKGNGASETDHISSSSKLINFDKRRKEFDIMIQIKILQASANNYSIGVNTDFWCWFKDCHHYLDYLALSRPKSGSGHFDGRKNDGLEIDDILSNLSLESHDISGLGSYEYAAKAIAIGPSQPCLRQTLSHYEKMAYAASVRIQSPLSSPNVATSSKPYYSPNKRCDVSLNSTRSPDRPRESCDRMSCTASGNTNPTHSDNYYPNPHSSPSLSSQATRSSIRSTVSSSLNNGKYEAAPHLKADKPNGNAPNVECPAQGGGDQLKLLDQDWSLNLSTFSQNLHNASKEASNAPPSVPLTPSNDDSGIDSLNNFNDVNNGNGQGIFSYNSSSRSSFKCNSSLASREEFLPPNSASMPLLHKQSLPHMFSELSGASSSTLFTSKNGSPKTSNQNCSDTPYKSCDLCIIKVSLDESIDNSLNTNMYKSIWITNSDKTPQVLAKALEKHGINEDVKKFYLYQIGLKPGEINSPKLLTLTNHILQHPYYQDMERPPHHFLLPDDANVFYGMREDCEPTFKIVRKYCQTFNGDDKKYFYSPPSGKHNHKYYSPIKRIFPTAASYFTNSYEPAKGNGPTKAGAGCAKKINEAGGGGKLNGQASTLRPTNDNNCYVQAQQTSPDKKRFGKQKRWKSASLLDVML